MSLWDEIGGTAALIFGRISGGDEKEITVDSDGHIQVDVLTTTGTATVDVSDRAARDLGKVDVAGIDAIGSVAGQKTKATSFPVTRPSDDEMLALVGAVDETAPASDTADAGLNGRLQRVAQRITSLIGLLPASIGQKAKTGSLAVTLASDEDLLSRVGEVQASPTSNTVLDRLKALATLLNGGLPAALGAGGGLKVDGSGTALPVSGSVTASGTVTANQGTAAAALAGWPAKDDGPAWTSAWGVSDAPVTSADMSGAAVAVTAAPTAGQKLVIDDILVSSDTALRFVFTLETSGAVIAHARVAANGTAQITFRGKRKLATADKRLFCQTSVAGNVEVLVGYHSEA